MKIQGLINKLIEPKYKHPNLYCGRIVKIENREGFEHTYRVVKPFAIFTAQKNSLTVHPYMFRDIKLGRLFNTRNVNSCTYEYCVDNIKPFEQYFSVALDYNGVKPNHAWSRTQLLELEKMENNDIKNRTSNLKK